MKIGQLASRTGVPARTIRYYEAIGVLPESSRTSSGYRTYGEDAVESLEFIRSAQAVGFTLGEIREIVALRDRGKTPCQYVLEVLAARAGQIEERIAQLHALREEINRLARRAARLDPADCDPREVCHLMVRDPAAQQPASVGRRSRP